MCHIRQAQQISFPGRRRAVYFHIASFDDKGYQVELSPSRHQIWIYVDGKGIAAGSATRIESKATIQAQKFIDAQQAKRTRK